MNAPNQFRLWTARDCAELLQLWHSGSTSKQCAKIFGRTPQAITVQLAKLQKRGNPVQPVLCAIIPHLGKIS